MRLTDVIVLQKPVKTLVEGEEKITFEDVYTLFANIKPMSILSSQNREVMVQGASFFTPIYSVYINSNLQDVTTEWRVKWLDVDYHILQVLKSTLTDVNGMGFLIRRVVS